MLLVTEMRSAMAKALVAIAKRRRDPAKITSYGL